MNFKKYLSFIPALSFFLVSCQAEGLSNRVLNPGFEEALLHWETVGSSEDNSAEDSGAHSGRGCLRVNHGKPVSNGGMRQLIELNQDRARSLRLSGWSRSKNVSMPKNSNYSIWCDVKYVRQKRPGRVDIAARVPFHTGTHGWQKVETILRPERAIKTIYIYALFRKHTGTAWFDDITVEELPPFRPGRRPKTGGKHIIVSASEGFQISLFHDGSVAGLGLGGKELESDRMAGLFVGDYVARDFWPVVGEVQEKEESVRVTSSIREAGLEVTAEFLPRGRAIEVRGWLKDTTGKDRSIDVCLALPAGSKGWHWSESLISSVPLTEDSVFRSSEFPVAAVTDSRNGIALAVPADFPSEFQFEYSPENQFLARLKLGLSPDVRGVLRSRAPFRFLIFSVEPAWGYRDALRRYYELNPRQFLRRAKQEGLWLFAFRPPKLPNPGDYAYWEGGPRGAEEAARKGIGSFPYLLPVQRSVTRLPTLPKDYEEAMRYLDKCEARRRGRSLREQIRNGAITREDGRDEIYIRNNVGADVNPKRPINMVVFSVNCNPRLFEDKTENVPGRDSLELAEYLVKESPAIRGIYLDSMSGWSGRKYNFRRDHFAYEEIPLTYEPDSGRVVAHGKYHGLEFLQALGELLWPGGRTIFQNLGPTRSFVWHYFYGDVCGIEGAYRHLSLENFLFYRSAAFQKPVLLLDYAHVVGRPTGLDTREGMERYWKYAVALGFYPAVGRYCDKVYSEHGDLYRKYLPVIRKLSGAGWRPVTLARTSARGVKIERFGPKDGKVFLTVFNPGKDACPAEMTLENEFPVINRDREAVSLITGRKFGNGSTLRVDLKALDVEVLEFEAGTAKSSQTKQRRE